MSICFICQENLNDDISMLYISDCNHEFHLECISLIRKLECPACRSPITLPSPIEKVIKQKEKDDEEVRILTQELYLMWKDLEPFLTEMIMLPTNNN